ncbi:MAG TPA: hypothetical protein VGH21_07690 [Solirubrobacteraceae bacterium]
MADLILSCDHSRETYRPNFRTSKIGGIIICSVVYGRSRSTSRATTTALAGAVGAQCAVREASDYTVELSGWRNDDYGPWGCWVPNGLCELFVVRGQPHSP